MIDLYLIADLGINLIYFQYPVRDNFKGEIKHLSLNPKMSTLNIEIKRSKTNNSS